MADKVTKRVVFQLDTDLKKINQQIDSFEKNLKQAKWAEKEAKAAGDEHKLALVQQQRAVSELREQRRKANEELKKHAAVQKETNGLMSQGLGALKGGMMGYLALGASVYKAFGYFKDLEKAGTDWEGTVGDLGPQTQKLADAVGNMIGQKDLSRLVEYQNQLNLTEKETNAIAQAAIYYGRVAKKDFGAALKEVTDAVVNGKTPALRKMGFAMDEVSGTKGEKMKAMLSALKTSFGDATAEASNAAEKQDAYNNRLADSEGKVGSIITKSEGYKKVLDAVAKSKVWLVEVIGDAIDGYKIMGEGLDRIVDKFEEAHYMIGDLINQTNNWGRIMRARALEADVAVLDAANKGLAAAMDKTKLNQALAKAQAEYEAYEDERQRKLTSKAKSGSKARAKETKDEYTSHLKLYQGYLKDEERALQRHNRNIERNAIDRFNSENRLAEQRVELAKKAIEKEAAEVERQREFHAQRVEMIQQHTNAFLQAAAANAVSAESFSGFMQSMLADTINYLSQLALKEAAKEAALGLAALGLTWGVPNPSSINHFLASAAWGALGIGGAVAGSAVGGSGRGGVAAGGAAGSSSGGGMSANSNYRDTSISSARESERVASAAPSVINNYYIKGRSDLLTKKDIQTVSKKLAQGRA